MNPRNRSTRSWLALATLAAAAVLAGCTSASSQSASSQSAASAAAASNAANSAAEGNPNLDLGSSLGNTPAPDIKLLNQFGRPVSLSQFRGKVVILAFNDSECTTVCPLTTQSMVLAKELLGAAGNNVQLLGVVANPRATGVADAMAYSRAHGMVNQWDFLTGTLAQLKAVWSAYHIAVEIQQGLIDHTPALYVISQQGRLQKVYLTQLAYSSVTQSAQVLAAEVAGLLPGHPKPASLGSLAAIPGQTPADTVTVPIAVPVKIQRGRNTPQVIGNSVVLRPGKPRLMAFFATWLTETSNLKAELAALNAYALTSARKNLPPLVAVDETATEPSAAAVRSYVSKLGALAYPVALDQTGRLADGYGVQDQPWLVLVNAAGKVTWSHDGWLPLPALEKAVAAHS